MYAFSAIFFSFLFFSIHSRPRYLNHIIMANLELSLGIVAILITIYVFSSLRISFDTLTFRSFYLPSKRRPTKVELIQETETVVEKESPFSLTWWNGDDIYQLEHRAIFSKVIYFRYYS